MMMEKAKPLKRAVRIKGHSSRVFFYDEFHQRRAMEHSYHAFGWRILADSEVAL